MLCAPQVREGGFYALRTPGEGWWGVSGERGWERGEEVEQCCRVICAAREYVMEG